MLADDPWEWLLMGEWMVELIGSRDVLDRLKSYLASSRHRVVEECNKYYLRPSQFDAVSDDRYVREEAKRIIRRANSYFALRTKIPNSIRMGNIIRKEQDRRTYFAYIESSVSISAAVSHSRELDLSDSDVFLLQENYSDVDEVLYLYHKALAGDDSAFFVNLYIIGEIIQSDIKGKISDKLQACKQAEFECFNKTAQVYRHAGKRRGDSPTKRMGRNEAMNLFERIIRKWLEYKSDTSSQ